jgi:hypothetical protein
MVVSEISVLLSVASSLSLYQPRPDEQPFIQRLLDKDLIRRVQHDHETGYHITLNAVRWREQHGYAHQSRGTSR